MPIALVPPGQKSTLFRSRGVISVQERASYIARVRDMAKGRRILSEAGCRKALELQIEGDDPILGQPVRYGMGFGLPGTLMPAPNPNSLFWGGYGGSLIIIDMDARATYAYAMNKMAATTSGDLRAFSLVMATMQGLMS